MNEYSLLSALSFVAVLIYMYVGIYTYRQNATSKINRVFFCLCTSYAVWSFAYAFAYVSDIKNVFSIWIKISALGWCTFSAILLYLVLLITESKSIKNRITIIAIFSPAAVFLYMTIFLFGSDINTSQLISDIFYVGDFLYNFIYLLLSIILLYIWGKKSDSVRVKKQSSILVTTGILPFLLNLLTQTILPAVGINKFPNMGQLYSLIMILGTFRVITRYKFLGHPENLILDEAANRMLEMFIFLDNRGNFIRLSNGASQMLGYKENELLNTSFADIISSKSLRRFKLSDTNQQVKNYSDITLIKKNGENIHANISYMPIFDNIFQDYLGAALVIQDISILYTLRLKNKELVEKATRDSLTKLYNHQYCKELLEKEIEMSNKNSHLHSLSVMMVDIDYFKKVNDIYGHQYGDYVLKTVSNILVDTISKYGYVGRYGGEEFILILPKANISKARALGESIRKQIEIYKFSKGLKLTISIGIKQYEGESTHEFIKKADELLYKSKRNGRNRIEYLRV